MIRIVSTTPVEPPKIIFREVTDPAEIARSRAQTERAWRNIDWLHSHWSDVLPQALGKCIAVAGQQAFIADTDEEARALAAAAHPGDDGMFTMYIRANQNAVRIYAHHG